MLSPVCWVIHCASSCAPPAAVVCACTFNQHTDAPKAAEGIYKRMSKQWAKLKARSDEVSWLLGWWWLAGVVSEGDMHTHTLHTVAKDQSAHS